MAISRLLMLSLGLLIAGPALADGDAEAGKNVFKKCVACHTAVAGQNKIGPSLFGVYGRPSASVETYAYSPAMKKFGKVWDEAVLMEYLTMPMKSVPGTKMSFNLPNENERRNVIAYLKTLK